MHDDILLIAGPEERDDELVALVAEHLPRRVTVLIEADDPSWSWSETAAALARRGRLATLLTAIERATGGAAVAGVVGEGAKLDAAAYDAVIRGRGLLSAA
jgi:chromosomal replication initiation ATPase DnaA